nr:hypothetical protein [Mucilaginibacter sp. L294]
MALKRASKRIRITSERINNYRFRVLTDGIDLSQYDLNPLMLWMHIRPFGSTKDQILALGNVIELKVEDDKTFGRVITGLPCFDESDTFAMAIYEKYENGTYRMASAGLRPVEWSEEPKYLLPGQTKATLTKSLLEEISLCDLGGNDDAVQVALYDENGDKIQLSQNGDNAAIPALKNPQIENEMNKIELTAEKAAVLLGLTEVKTADQFETKVMEVVQLAQRQKTQIETLEREKLELTNKVTEHENAGLKDNTKVMLSQAVTDRKITQDEVPFYESQIRDKAGFDKVKLHLDGKAANPSIQSVVKPDGVQLTGKYAGKTWAELDKSGDLVQLKKDDLNLFKTLYKAEFSKEWE